MSVEHTLILFQGIDGYNQLAKVAWSMNGCKTVTYNLLRESVFNVKLVPATHQ